MLERRQHPVAGAARAGELTDVARQDEIRLFRQSSERAMQCIAQLGVLSDDPARLKRLCGRVELFLWKFIRMRWYDIHRFFSSVEPKEAMELARDKYQPGMVFHFFSVRQDSGEWENCMTVGLSL